MLTSPVTQSRCPMSADLGRTFRKRPSFSDKCVNLAWTLTLSDRSCLSLAVNPFSITCCPYRREVSKRGSALIGSQIIRFPSTWLAVNNDSPLKIHISHNITDENDQSTLLCIGKSHVTKIYVSLLWFLVLFTKLLVFWDLTSVCFLILNRVNIHVFVAAGIQKFHLLQWLLAYLITYALD